MAKLAVGEAISIKLRFPSSNLRKSVSLGLSHNSLFYQRLQS